MLEGMGRLVFRTLNLNDNVAYVGRLNNFKIAEELETGEAKAFPFSGGAQTVVDSIVKSRTYTLTVGTASFDKLDLSMMMDELIQTSASVTLPTSAQGTVPSSTAYEITVSGLTANQSVQVQVISDTAPEQLEQVTSTPAAAGEYQITSGKIVFHSGDAGKTVVYTYSKAYSAVETIGVEPTFERYGIMSFSGIILGPRFTNPPKLYLPKVKRKSGYEISASDGDTQVDLEYSIETPISGRPVQLAFGIAA